MGGYAAHAVSVDSQIMRKYNAVDRYPRVDGKAVHPMSHLADFP